ncbi:unnamed protein product [Pleuronectes platessa]|uniref:Uncharacterized protein n=1 Tax=Pleuronectes platessa TaxID=8262 RepID=A0A9N7U4S9_PLEPL|nr:unnamed protein product [Pleuronectes platessa]
MAKKLFLIHTRGDKGSERPDALYDPVSLVNNTTPLRPQSKYITGTFISGESPDFLHFHIHSLIKGLSLHLELFPPVLLRPRLHGEVTSAESDDLRLSFSVRLHGAAPDPPRLPARPS